MEIKKTFSVEYSGKRDQYYDNRVHFDSEEEADAFIQKLIEENEAVYQIFKTITTSYYKR